VKTVGERHWTHGPVLLTSAKLHGRFVKAFTKGQAKVFARLKKVGVATFENEHMVVMPTNEETGVVRWSKDDDVVVLVHAHELEGHFLEKDRVKMIESIDPRTIPPESWTKVDTIGLPANPVLFDIHAGHPEGSKIERKTKLDVPLAGGEYVVEVATGEAKAKPYPSKVVSCNYTFVRLRPADWQQGTTEVAAHVTDEGPIVASPEVIAGTKKLKSASGDGIPMMVVPKKYLPDWGGIGDGEDEDAGTDYDRACDVSGVAAIKIGKGKGLVISEPGGVMWWPTKQGGLLVIWLGADSTTGCVAAALSIPDKSWKKESAKLVVEKGAGTFVIFDSASAGKELKKTGKIGPDDNQTAELELAPGTYAIDSCWSWEAEVKVGKKVEATMIAALRLRRA
jgi:hypothetical protein